MLILIWILMAFMALMALMLLVFDQKWRRKMRKKRKNGDEKWVMKFWSLIAIMRLESLCGWTARGWKRGRRGHDGHGPKWMGKTGAAHVAVIPVARVHLLLPLCPSILKPVKKYEGIFFIKNVSFTAVELLCCPAVFGHFFDPPGNHPRGAFFPTVDQINQSSVDFYCKPFDWLIDWLTIS